MELVENIGEFIALNPLLAFTAVFFGGILSSANPCVIVTIPMIIGYVGGYAGNNKKKAFVYALGHCVLMLLAGTFIGVAQCFIRSKGISGFSYWTKKVSGAVITAVGVYVLFM